MAVRDDISVNWTLSPRIISVAAPSTEVILQDLHDTLRDIEDEPDAMQYTHLISSAGKEELGGGVTVGITSTLLNARIAFDARKVSQSTGTVTTTDTTSRFLYDAAADFVADGVDPGAWIVNITDQSICSVLRVVSSTQLQTDFLGDGADNEFTFGDVYKIWPVIQTEVAGGNLVAEDDIGDPLDAILPTAGTQVVRTSSSSATLQELAAIQFASYNAGVTVKPSSIYSGTEYPVGTLQQPVNNMSDALTIANERGLGQFFLLESITLTTLDFSNKTFMSGNPGIMVTIDASADIDETKFVELEVTGVFDSTTHLFRCRAVNTTALNGAFFEESRLAGTIGITGSGTVLFTNCVDDDAGGSLPTIDMTGFTSDLAIRAYAGDIKLENHTGVGDVSIDLNAGTVELDSTVTAGTFMVRGIGSHVDNSTGTATVDASDLVTNASVADAVFEEPTADHNTAGTFGNAINRIRKFVSALLGGL